MRTTLEIDDAVLEQARQLAREQGVSTSAVVSRLLGQALTGRTSEVGEGEHPDDKSAGFRRSRRRATPMDNQDVERMRQKEGL